MPERLVFAYGDKTAQHTASQHSDVFVLKASTRWGFFCDMTATVLQVMASVLARGSGVDAADQFKLDGSEDRQFASRRLFT